MFYIRIITDKIELIGKVQGSKKRCNLKKVHFRFLGNQL